jgi:poly[(R)-3-hydroxyalkanoate] polymerase subunit PhaC
MKERPSNGASLVEAWTQLADTTMAGYPAAPIVEALSKAQQGRQEDPWIAFIDRLWDANPYATVVPIDFGEILSVFQRVWLDALSNPTRLWVLYSDFMQQYTQVMTSSGLKFWGLDQESKPVIEPEAGDKRFSAPDWQQNPAFDALKQYYLLTAMT